jgi:hypothetical protein
VLLLVPPIGVGIGVGMGLLYSAVERLDKATKPPQRPCSTLQDLSCINKCKVVVGRLFGALGYLTIGSGTVGAAGCALIIPFDEPEPAQQTAVVMTMIRCITTIALGCALLGTGNLIQKSAYPLSVPEPLPPSILKK